MTPRTRFAAAFAWACGAVVAAVYILRGAFVPSLVDALKYGRGDCVINWLGARAWQSHVDIYSPAGLKWAGISVMGHPPTTPMWYMPFAGYGIFELSQIFGHLLLFMLLVHLVLVAAELRAPVPLATAFLGYALVMDTSWWVYHVDMIQLSEPIALLYVLAWICLRRDHDIASGILLGLACTMKLYAGLVLLVFVVARRWGAIVAAAIVYLVFAIVATWHFGLACWLEYLPMVRDTQRAWMPVNKNASLHGIIVRMGAQSHGPHLTFGSKVVIAWLIAAAIVAGIVWLSRRALAPKSPAPPVDEAVDLPFALFTTASVWLNPVVWEHYDVTLLFPMALALAVVWRQGGRMRWVWIAAVTALLLFVCWTLSFDIHAKDRAQSVIGQRWYITANWLPWPILLATLGALLWRRERLNAGAAARPA